jgi:hypothetical protein
VEDRASRDAASTENNEVDVATVPMRRRDGMAARQKKKSRSARVYQQRSILLLWR